MTAMRSTTNEFGTVAAGSAEPFAGSTTRLGGRARFAVVTDATASAVVGAGLVAGAGGLDSAFGTTAQSVAVVGVVMLAWAMALAVILRRGDVTAPALRAIIALNAAWVVASLAVAVVGWDGRTAVGTGFVLAQALAVAGLTELQFTALKAAGRARA